MGLQGVRVPEVLQKYIPGEPTFIPYTKELPKDSTSQRTKVEPTVSSVTEKLAGLKQSR